MPETPMPPTPAPDSPAPGPNATVRLHPSWREPLHPIFGGAEMQKLKRFLLAEKSAGRTLYPKGSAYFRALDLTPLDQVKVVILGQDPYHGPGQAHGLAFSVPLGVRPPPSLVNIYKELQADLGIPPPRHGLLDSWAQQGVLLLNSVLSVRAGEANSHRDRGWEGFTDAVIRLVNDQDRPIVFLLWGSYAQKKAAFVSDVTQGGRHMVLKSPHPSPLSAHGGFFGSRPFSRTNAFLVQNGIEPIAWALPDT